MHKPNWNDAPKWANWLAMDRDGTWWWCESEPIMEYGNQWNTYQGQQEVAYNPLARWCETKKERPENDN